MIGSSALALHGWKVAPGDLDLMAPTDAVTQIEVAIGPTESASGPVDDGEARRIEYRTPRGLVDVYLAVSGGLTFEMVRREAITVLIGEGGTAVPVGRVDHVRDMRAALGRDSLPAEASPPTASNKPLVIAIDGPAGAGKSTVSRALARRIGFTYLNTGAMYRCVALVLLEREADPDDREVVAAIANDAAIEFDEERVLLGGRDVSDAIRTEAVTVVTPHIAAYPDVRTAMIHRQRQLFERRGGFVAEGRDTGTVVTPEAPLKIYLTASIRERAGRRAEETGEPVAGVMSALQDRDRLDKERAMSALRVAEDAVVVDTTGRSVQDVVDEIASLAHDRGIA